MLVLAALAAAVQGQTVPAFVVAGTDAAGDSHNDVAPGADSGQFANARTDIRFVAFGEDDKTLYVKLGIGTQPSGTGGYMYHVLATAKGTIYSTCFAIQFTANAAEATQENTVGCSRFTGVTAVGPATTAAGVQRGDEEGGAFVLWPVARTSVGGAGIADLTDISADTWFRGASNCCPGSTTQAQYVWNQADRAPDTGTFAIDPSLLAPPAPAFALALEVAANVTKAEVNGTAHFTLTVHIANGTAPDGTNVTLRILGLPDGWNVTFTPADLTVSGNASAAGAADGNGTGGNATGNATGNSTGNATAGNGTGNATAPGNTTGNVTAPRGPSSELRIIVPANATLGFYNLTAQAYAAGNLSALAALVVEVVPQGSLAKPSGDNTTNDPVAKDPKGKKSPGAGIPLVVVSLAAIALRRRRQ